MTRQRRGRDTELRFAEWLQDNGYPHAKAVSAGAAGADILDTPGVSFELKARASFNPAGWLKQAERRDGLAVVVMRLNGQGTTDPSRYFAGLRLGSLMRLLEERR